MKRLQLLAGITLVVICAIAIWQVSPLRPHPKPAASFKTCEERGMQSGYSYLPIDDLGCPAPNNCSVIVRPPNIECFTTGNRVDSQGRLNANGDYALDKDWRPVRITLEQEKFMEEKPR
jgi:hypothetical protein